MANADEVILKDQNNIEVNEIHKDVEFNAISAYEEVIKDMAEITIKAEKCKQELECINRMSLCNDYKAWQSMIDSMTDSVEAIGVAMARVIKVSNYCKNQE